MSDAIEQGTRIHQWLSSAHANTLKPVKELTDAELQDERALVKSLAFPFLYGKAPLSIFMKVVTERLLALTVELTHRQPIRRSTVTYSLADAQVTMKMFESLLKGTLKNAYCTFMYGDGEHCRRECAVGSAYCFHHTPIV